MPSNKKLLQAAAGSAGGDDLYVEDVLSTFLYTGNGSTQTITNGIDLAGEGGLVWIKNRDATDGHVLTDTIRGVGKVLSSDSTAAEATNADTTTAFNSDGFSIGADVLVNTDTEDYVSWSFRKAEKFFDIVTYTGTGDSAPGQTVAHNLGSTPGFMIIKRTDTTSDWSCYHSGLTSNEYYLKLNNTSAETEDGTVFPSAPTDSNFYVRADRVNASGGTFVAYLFASDAGGFGDDDENIIKCGSVATAWSAVEVNVGFEPQFVIAKVADRTDPFRVFDNMRGVITGGNDALLRADQSYYENQGGASDFIDFTSTGFIAKSELVYPSKLIYIAIRRPMKTPAAGTEVFVVDDRAAATPSFVSDFPVDLYWTRAKTSGNFFDYARLRGDKYLQHDGTNAETSGGAYFDSNTGVGSSGSASTNNLAWMFKRATGFFDVVAYSGTGSATTITHNLGVVPELMIVKQRSGSSESWTVWNKTIAAINSAATLWINSTSAVNNFSNRFNSTAPTDSVFSVEGDTSTNGSGSTYVNYLFATLAGVSKVGSYTGTGSDLNVDCGFSAGARFILIKRTDSTGDWYYWDSARGIVVGNDPYQLLNSNAAEVTNTDYVDPLNAGFTVTSSASSTVNVSSGTYIFLAIA